MFIKKDLRKIPTILDDAVDCNTYDAEEEQENNADDDNTNDKTKKKRMKREEPLTVLRLARRKQEFNGTVQVLCEPDRYGSKLKYLQTLNLYECDIHSLDGFGEMFSFCAPKLSTVNLGRNPLPCDGIPPEFAQCVSVQHLWLDDCKLTGSLPVALLQLPNLESLRLPNNNITDLNIHNTTSNNNSTAMIPLPKLKILCLDRNNLGSGDSTSGGGGEGVLPSNLAEWLPNLEELLLRQNSFKKLGVTKWPQTLKILQVSSNQLEDLNEIMMDTTNGSNSKSNDNEDEDDTLRPMATGDNDDDDDGATSTSTATTTTALPALTHLYANGNQLKQIPEGILTQHPKLQRLVISHNAPLIDLPHEMWQQLGLLNTYDDDNNDGSNNTTSSSSDLEIVWKPNPNLIPPGSDNNNNNTARNDNDDDDNQINDQNDSTMQE